ncbi:hypothetical protein I0E51_18980 [Pseudomonas lalucatii]|nr:hypothetical protein [Pseudomonas lalucatii]
MAIGFLPLCIDALQGGGLRPLWPGRRVSGGALWAVWPATAQSPALLRVVDWLEARLAGMETRSAEFSQPWRAEISLFSSATAGKSGGLHRRSPPCVSTATPCPPAMVTRSPSAPSARHCRATACC